MHHVTYIHLLNDFYPHVMFLLFRNMIATGEPTGYYTKRKKNSTRISRECTVYDRIKAGLKYTQGLKYTPGTTRRLS